VNKIIAALHEHASYIGQHRAIEDEKSVVSYRQLLTRVEHVAARLTVVSPHVVAIIAENGIAPVVADLAAMSLGVPVVVLPPNFSRQQSRDVIRKFRVDCVLTDRPDDFAQRGIDRIHEAIPLVGELVAIELVVDGLAPGTLPAGIAKVIVDIAETGEPKIFCIGRAELEYEAESLLGVAASMQGDRHLCLLPLANANENIGGIYTAILAGATSCVPQLENVGLVGESIRIDRLVASLERWCATSVMTSPKILRSLVHAAGCGTAVANTIRYVAAAGVFPSALLAEADRQRIQVYEGRALVERTAVVSIDRPRSRHHAHRGVNAPSTVIAMDRAS
jgi:acyl-coenzyme A synthetase/AMP-(fatty) acid ligase